jgi:hypothetical protein
MPAGTNIIPLGFFDVTRLTGALVMRHETHFQDDMRRQSYAGSPHHDTQSILLRGPRGEINQESWFQDVPHEDAPLLAEWPSARQVLAQVEQFHINRINQACQQFGMQPPPAPDFGKIMVVSLKAGGWVDWHVDTGAYADAHDRFHICLVPSPYAWLYAGPDSAILPMGQMCYLNNRIPHCATNFGSTPRVHLIHDVRRVVPPNQELNDRRSLN